MDTKEAILAFSQSERPRRGCSWPPQLLEIYNGLPIMKNTPERFLRPLIGMIRTRSTCQENDLGRAVSSVEKSLNSALVMMNSGVLSEATFHIVQAISAVTTIGQRSMEFLIREKLL